MSAQTKTAFILGTWFGSGKAPVASGTFGSFAALPFAWGIMMFGGWLFLLISSVIIYFIGVWSADIVMRETGIEDPGLIVIDEVVGQWLALLTAPLDPISYLIAFLFFRFFDILKPWPACWADSKLHSATGVMLDDVFAGLYALICSSLTTYYFIPQEGWLALAKELLSRI
ncbi:MAG: phosphatidylglycerophosphatase A [Alphaproteobacteria bacterium]|nr:phosphatidylglycerophosphatase A [Alphaproteobacteria bacterium]